MGNDKSIPCNRSELVPVLKLKSFVLGLLLSLAPVAAFAACTGQFTTAEVCANPTGSTAVPTGTPLTTLLDRLYGSNAGTIIYRGPTSWQSLTGNISGTQILSENGSGVPSWITVSGTGTVTSVGLSAPSEFTVSGSPVTSTGTLTFVEANESANKIAAGPTSGGAAPWSFRGLVIGDFPSIAANTVIGNGTGSGAVPTALSMPSCSGASNALIWTSATGFGCNTLTSTGTVTSIVIGGRACLDAVSVDDDGDDVAGHDCSRQYPWERFWQHCCASGSACWKLFCGTECSYIQYKHARFRLQSYQWFWYSHYRGGWPDGVLQRQRKCCQR